MNNKFINEMSNMFSLMERMGKHATLNEAISNKKYYLMEASGTGQQTPAIRLVPQDTGNLFDVYLHGIYREDADNITSCGFGEIDQKPEIANPNDPNKDIVTIKFDNLDNIDDAESVLNDIILPTIGDPSMTTNSYNLSELKKATDPNIMQSYLQSTPSQAATAGFNNMMNSAIASGLENLKMDNIGEVKKYIMTALNDGTINQQQANSMAQQIVAREVEEVGHQLWPKSVVAIEYQAKYKYGLNPGDPEWPTFVACSKTWYDLGRRVVATPKHKYYYDSPIELNTKHKALDNYNQKHPNNQLDWARFTSLPYQEQEVYRLVNNPHDFKLVVGYDITDTEDTSGFDKFFNEPGLINNLTGDLNDLAKANIANAEAQEAQPDPNTVQTPQPVQQNTASGNVGVQRYLSLEGAKKLADDLGVQYNETGNIDADVTNIVFEICKKIGHDSYHIIKKDDEFLFSLAAMYTIGRLPHIDKSIIKNMVQRSGINGNNVSSSLTSKSKIQALDGIAKTVSDGIKTIGKKLYAKINTQQAANNGSNPQQTQQAYSLVSENYNGKKFMLEMEDISFGNIIRKYLM